MALNKFEGDSKLPTADELLSSVEHCNKEPSSVALVICSDRSLPIVHDCLQRNSYKDTQTFGFHKQYKSDKNSQAGFISSLLFAVIGFKRKSILQLGLVTLSKD